MSFYKVKMMLPLLNKYRHVLLLVLVLIALANGVWRFNGNVERFFAMVVGQLWFVQGMYCYMSGRTISIAPASVGKNASPLSRAAVATVALVCYVVILFLPFNYRV
ncbi:hypothetical protein ACSHWC_25310 [Pseudomonas fluorescens]